MFYISDYQQRIRKIHGALCVWWSTYLTHDMLNELNNITINGSAIDLGLDWKFML